MPYTVNGIGTHYYGKKNRSNRTAACKSCGKVGVLDSYDTRLWFVVVFIPLIPLGRKRITDKCPRCTRHYAADLHQYEQARQLQVSAGLERFRRELSAEAALEAHGQLLAFHENEQATQFRATALEKFPIHAALRAGLAAQLEHAAAYAESAELFEAALQQDPELPEARVGVARRRMVKGELDEARRLLNFLEVAGAGQYHAMGPIDVLSGYFQKAGRHEEALALATGLLRELPAAGQQHAFRSFIRRSEKALGRPETILPPAEHALRGLFRAEGSPYPSWMRKLVIGSVAVALLAGGLFFSNEYIRRNRVIKIVNACGDPVRVQLDDMPPVEFSSTGSLAVGEGHHHIQVTGAVQENLDVDVATGFFERWFNKPLWVLNPGGEAVLQESTVHYAEIPQPGAYHLLIGQSFISLPHVDHAFERPPDQIKLKNKNQEVTKIAFQWIQGADNAAFLELCNTDLAGALAFAERRLRRYPDQSELIDSYLGHTLPQQAKRVEEFLKSGLDRRPVVVRWHRAYQAAADMNGHDQGLIPFYDGLMKSAPLDGALIYLRGRIDPDREQQREYFHRASKASPTLPWPWMALGTHSAAEANWGECLIDLKKARELKVDPQYIRDELHVAGLATGGADGLATEYQSRLAANPMDFPTVPLLTDALLVSGHPEKVGPALGAWEIRLDQSIRPVLSGMMRAVALYQEGKLEECRRLCEANGSLRGNVYRFQSLLALGHAKEAAADPAFEPLKADPWAGLSMSLGLALDGHKKEADQWRDRACEKLEKLPRDFREIAGLLRAAQPPALDSLSRISVDIDVRALIFAVLSQRFNARRAEFGAMAARFNISRKFPYQLVQRTLGKSNPALP